ncbi:hypothetical protein ACFOMD_00450 [Sphingoaurantiacus capsulatus]|uniref:Uncharacterized protein n=1 Tax=Sphingoaurantiacus capsulatus TaxID=1771310 RepID=A0ABV7X726_9SPHN
MRHLLLTALALTALSTTSTHAQDVNPHINYAGEGGARVTTGGIDFWQGGEPPRKYRVLGTIVDRRGAGRFAGTAIGSKGVAKQVRALGGDAVLVVSQLPAGDEIATTMTVVKYVN